MNLLLKRRPTVNKTTIGELYHDDKLICFTCEDEIRPAGVKIPGETCIPPGIYEVGLVQPINYAQRYGRPVTTPWVLNVPGFTGILIHPGNTAADTAGCLLPGMKVGADGVSLEGAGLAYGMLCLLIGGAIGAGEKVHIDIENPEN